MCTCIPSSNDIIIFHITVESHLCRTPGGLQTWVHFELYKFWIVRYFIIPFPEMEISQGEVFGELAVIEEIHHTGTRTSVFYLFVSFLILLILFVSSCFHLEYCPKHREE